MTISTASERAQASARQSRRLRLPIKIVDDYLFWQTVGATWRGFVWFAGLLAAVAIISAARRMVNQSLPISMFVTVVGYEAPRIVLFTLPMAILFGTAQSFSELSERGEVTALYGGGLSLWRLMRAPLCWGLLLLMLAASLQEIVVPVTQRAEDAGIARAVIARGEVKQNLRFEDPPANRGPLKSVLQAARFDVARGVLTRPRLQRYDSDGRVKLEISAESARWDERANMWELFNGETVSRQQSLPAPNGEAPRAPVVISRFESMKVKAAGPSLLGKATLSVRQHLDHGDYEVVSAQDLWAYRDEMQAHATSGADARALKKSVGGATYGLHDKIATPFLCLVLVMVGVPLGVRPPRSGTSFAMGISIAVLLFYYGIWTWCNTMGTSGSANPVLMAYLPLTLLLIIGLTLLKRKSG